jgi:broad specificity phosphatase PhoE
MSASFASSSPLGIPPASNSDPYSAATFLSSLSSICRGGQGFIAFLRHASRNSLIGMTQAQRDAEPINATGTAEATAMGQAIKKVGMPISGCMWLGSYRAEQTARALAASLGVSAERLQELNGVPLVRLKGYESFKEKHGWEETLRRWLHGSVPTDVMASPLTVVESMVHKSLSESHLLPSEGQLLIIVTHDLFVFAMLTVVKKKVSNAIPYMGGIVLAWEEMIMEDRIQARGKSDRQASGTTRDSKPKMDFTSF